LVAEPRAGLHRGADGGEALLLAGLRREPAELVRRMFEPVAVARRGLRSGPGRGERLFEAAQALPRNLDLAGVDPAINVEQGPVPAWIEQAAIVMLAVDLDEQCAELALQAGGDRLVVDEG